MNERRIKTTVGEFWRNVLRPVAAVCNDRRTYEDSFIRNEYADASREFYSFFAGYRSGRTESGGWHPNGQKALECLKAHVESVFGIPPTHYKDMGDWYRYNTAEWGRIYWRFLHTASIAIAVGLNRDERHGVSTLPITVLHLDQFLPCPSCASHYRRLAESGFVEQTVLNMCHGRVAFSLMVLHNAVTNGVNKERGRADTISDYGPSDFAADYGFCEEYNRLSGPKTGAGGVSGGLDGDRWSIIRMEPHPPSHVALVRLLCYGLPLARAYRIVSLFLHNTAYANRPNVAIREFETTLSLMATRLGAANRIEHIEDVVRVVANNTGAPRAEEATSTATRVDYESMFCNTLVRASLLKVNLVVLLKTGLIDDAIRELEAVRDFIRRHSVELPALWKEVVDDGRRINANVAVCPNQDERGLCNCDDAESAANTLFELRADVLGVDTTLSHIDHSLVIFRRAYFRNKRV